MRWLDGNTDSMDEFGQAQGDGEGEGSLACHAAWGHKESDMTERLHLMVFPVVMYGCESWTMKKAEH